MALEDFFTWNEINDGLKDPARVKELVAVMQKENDCVVKNTNDVTRQWSAVASAIAATENPDCLQLFIELEGLQYLNRWLKAAGNVRNNTSDSSVKDLIANILQKLERLQVDNDRLISSGIWMTVEDLNDHSSSKVQERAKTLFNSWNKQKENDGVQMEVEKNGALADEGMGANAEHAGRGSAESCNGDINVSRGNVTVEKQEEASKGNLPSIGFETLKAEEMNSGFPDDAGMKKEKSHSTDPSSLSEPANENLHVNLEPPRCSESAARTETCSSSGLKQGAQEGELHTPELDSTDDVKQMQRLGSSPEKVDQVEDPKSAMSTNDTDASESPKELDIKKISDVIVKECSSKTLSSAGLRTAVSEAKSKTNDDISSSFCRSSMVFRRKEDGDYNSDVFQDSNTSEHKLVTFKNSGTLSRKIDNGVNKNNSDRSESGLPKDYDFPNPRMVRRDNAVDKKSDLDLDYGIVDALELARQVAIEVEREVEDCREQSCSSSEKELSSKVRRPETPHSVSGMQCQNDQSSLMAVPTGPDFSLNLPIRDVPANSAGNLEAEQINGTLDGESSQVTEAEQEVEANTEKDLSQFDLNQEVCSEDTEQGDILSPPVSVVSASRAAAAPGMPVAPLQFEGTLGWKGSAATSAFRPASPCRGLENDSGLSANGSNSSSKQNRGFLNFDLNVAESGDDRITDLQSRKEIPVSSRFASRESSAEVSPGRLEKLGLDLNQIGDDGSTPPDWRPEGELFHQRNGHHNQSSPSCSSSSKQPSIRNIDLNDQPIFANDSSNNHYYGKSSQNLSSSGGIRSDDSVISIMGMRVEVNRRNSAAQTLPFPNGRTPEPANDVNFLRNGGILGMGSLAPYPHPPVYGYNGLAAGPAMPFSSPMYGAGGPITYMVDSRGAPVVPQFMGTSSALPPGFPQPPFVFTMTGTPSSNSVGPMQNNFDLNSGLILEGGNRDLGGFRQLFNPAQTRVINEQFKSNSQPSSNSDIGGGKRKEPDGGWEPYNFIPHSQPRR